MTIIRTALKEKICYRTCLFVRLYSPCTVRAAAAPPIGLMNSNPYFFIEYFYTFKVHYTIHIRVTQKLFAVQITIKTESFQSKSGRILYYQLLYLRWISDLY